MLCKAESEGSWPPNRSQLYNDGYKLSAFFPSSAKSFHLVVVWKMSKTQQIVKQLYKPLISKGKSLYVRAPSALRVSEGEKTEAP